MTVPKGTMKSRRPLDCICAGERTFCAPCTIALAIAMKREHPDSLSVAMLKRRLPGISGREAAVLIEVTRHLV